MIRMTKLVPFTTALKNEHCWASAGAAEPDRFQCGRYGELFYYELVQTALLTIMLSSDAFLRKPVFIAIGKQ